ncbi:hypothetical protein J1605_001713, partial [Eschrichtius robustus]
LQTFSRTPSRLAVAH